MTKKSIKRVGTKLTKIAISLISSAILIGSMESSTAIATDDSLMDPSSAAKNAIPSKGGKKALNQALK